MKKTFIGLFLLLLTSCRPTSPIEAFDVSEKCPHVCWLGITPGITTETEVKAILSNSKQIRKKSINIDETGIGAEWFLGTSSSNPVGISFENGVVKQMWLDGFPLTVGDFVNLLGNPDEIGISINEVADATYIDYILFYSSQQSAVFASSINNNGPDPTDTIDVLILTDELSRGNAPRGLIEKYEIRQRWLGFGHLKDYFPGQRVPLLGSWAGEPTSP